MNPLAILGRLGNSVAVPPITPPAAGAGGAFVLRTRAKKAVDKPVKKVRQPVSVGRIFAVGARARVRFKGGAESEGTVAAIGRRALIRASGFTKEGRASRAAARATRPVECPVPAAAESIRAQRHSATAVLDAVTAAEIDAQDTQDLADLEEMGALR